MKEFLKPLPILFIPLLNITIVLIGLFTIIGDWVENDDKWQDFLNKKL